MFIFLQFGDAAIPDVVYVHTMARELFLEEVAVTSSITETGGGSTAWTSWT